MLKAAAAEVAAKQATSRLIGAALSMNGIFAVNKPPGISCTGLLDYFKRNIGRGAAAVPFEEHYEQEKELRNSGKKIRRRRYSLNLRVGHGGTLDVEAAGVMIIGVNKGCKLLSEYLNCGKSYLANARFGVATDSCDAEGVITNLSDPHAVTGEMLNAVIPKFVGSIQQMPPIYSAIKVDGKRLYDYARGGHEIPAGIKKRQVNVSSIKMLFFENPHSKEQLGRRVVLPVEYSDYFDNGRYRWSVDPGTMKVGNVMTPFANNPNLPFFQLLVQSGSGVYIRSLIDDMGSELGCSATMISLLRTSQGSLRLNHDTINVEDLAYVDRVIGAIRHVDNVLQHNIESQQTKI
ncbi:pseudouridine synthase [Coemansia reversa NRRL 1564]|uniref:tRNA pseudouridine(55) synthase n=1 Tax=Coemansia reversa (strain ATCC 12441 / NRRL 1564) TaxID=763665 RepID=A0A2G5B7V9_COERN|nr:pseudouridine synthase [Coemansia reversa NRRL 1564]|eukprot:PIA15081.1 pseudouridine synthase [Coemansia reversa NRRL 1564]